MRILLPTDYSLNAVHAMEYAIRLFGATGNRFMLVHVYYEMDPNSPASPVITTELIAAAESGMREFVDRIARSTGADGIEPSVRIGPMPFTVNEMVREHRIDLVVMGKRGEGGSRFFGSNTTDMIKQAKVPVLAVPEQAPLKDVRRILLASDHEDVSAKDLDVLREIAQLRNAEVVIAHVSAPDVPKGPHWSEGIYDVGLRDVPHRFITVEGEEVTDTLVESAARAEADMIAVVHRKAGFLARLFDPSLAKELALHSTLPLLVLQHSKA